MKLKPKKIIIFLTVYLLSLTGVCLLFIILIRNLKIPSEIKFINSGSSTIFASPSPSPSPSLAPTISLITTGDVGLVRTVNYQIAQNGSTYPFEKTADLLESSDLTLINLEGPLIENCPTTNEGMIFCGNKKNVKGLVFAGVDIANLANNHIANYEEDGINQTIQVLKENGIDYIGLDNILVREIQGVKIAFLGFNFVGGIGDKQQVANQVSQAKKLTNLVLVSFHWGEEYVFEPNDLQVELAHLAIDNGADLVIGHHPHVVQTIEEYKDKLIVYSLGNFIFDQMWSLETQQGIIGKYTFSNNQLVDYEFIPIQIENFSQPRILEGEEAKSVLERLCVSQGGFEPPTYCLEGSRSIP